MGLGFKKKFHRLVRKNFFIAFNLEYRRYLESQDPSREPLIVFQMGKVGSSTLVTSLKQMEIGQPVYQVHVLSKEWIDNAYRMYREASRINGRAIVDEHLLASRYLRARIDQRSENRQWKVITLIRDPVARNISAFFQAFPIHYPGVMKRFNAGGMSVEDRCEEMIGLFLDDFDKHQLPVNWFDHHMKPAFGIDVYDEAFDPALGYHIYDHEHASLLLLRLEDLRESAGDALRAFMNIDRLMLQQANVSEDKHYAGEYRLFRTNIRLPGDYLDALYDTRYMRHFYSGDEIAQLRQKWGH